MVWAKPFFVAAFFMVLCIYILYNVSFLDNNDFMYAAAPLVWLQNGTLYRDVPFIQAPLIIIINLGIMKIFSAENVFVVSRVLSIVLVLAAVLTSAFALRRVKNPQFILLYILLCLSNSFILSNSREMGSYSQPLFLISIAFALQTLTIAPWKRGLFVGIAIGLATAAKLNFILIAPAFLLLLLLEVEWSWSIVAWFCFGVFAGAMPLLYYLAVAFNALYEHAVRFHHLTLQARGLGANGSPAQLLYSLLRFRRTHDGALGIRCATISRSAFAHALANLGDHCGFYRLQHRDGYRTTNDLSPVSWTVGSDYSVLLHA